MRASGATSRARQIEGDAPRRARKAALSRRNCHHLKEWRPVLDKHNEYVSPFVLL